MDTPQGWLVPVLKGANPKSSAEIAAGAGRPYRLRADKMLADDLPQGTFPRTNLGLKEIDTFSPIIIAPGWRSLARDVSYQRRESDTDRSDCGIWFS